MWDATKPSNSGLLINFPGECRANWDALSLGTDAALLVTNAKVAAGAAIVESKILFNAAGHDHTGTTAGKLVPLATGTSGVLATSRGGTGSSATANTADGLVILTAAGYLPALNASLLTGLTAAQIPSLDASKITTGYLGTARLGSGSASASTYLRGDSTWATVVATTAVADTDAGTTANNNDENTFLSVAKTITSGHTVLLIASGYYTAAYSASTSAITIRLKHDSTTDQATLIPIREASYAAAGGWACTAIVTGLSGSVTFSVTFQRTGGVGDQTGRGNLSVIEF